MFKIHSNYISREHSVLGNEADGEKNLTNQTTRCVFLAL